METDWAAEHLQTIRTLMERSAVYRRALAPIMVWNGIVGIAGGIVGSSVRIDTDSAFILFWSGAAILAIIGSFLLVRRQALKDSEPFWSPPTRRVAQAILPPILIGAVVNVIGYFWFRGQAYLEAALLYPVGWLFLYGCAAHAAGFFMTRGMRLFGWIFILLGGVLLASRFPLSIHFSPFVLMSATFGGLHLAYGIYLYITEKGKNAS
jgi:hypothetical protein